MFKKCANIPNIADLCLYSSHYLGDIAFNPICKVIFYSVESKGNLFIKNKYLNAVNKVKLTISV